ncbi:MAG TPA: CDP-diacylglycerol--glycerol-3-phosphate 3-phosphatidyltransferase [Mycobacteriales bacterium]|nr:CDP-diacylglycerol--glycerol-3-phosphate 3-phosphatidyltransferase [Mycobacteriales bacterium]
MPYVQAEVGPPAARVVNPANGLTVLRLLLVPVFLVLLLTDDGQTLRWRLVAAAVFGIASATDRVDGQLARSRGMITPFGQIADPIADKALTGAAFIGLSLLDELAWWITALVIVREIGVTMLRFVVIRHGIIPASRGGKLKTVLQGIAIALYVLPFTGALATARTVVMVAAVAVTVVTGADYVARAMKLRRTSPRAEMKRRRRAHYDRTG